MSKLLEIFRAGTHKDSEGREWTFTKEQMAASVAAYDPVVFAAPLVIGHPKMEDPAYGLVKSINLDGDLVVAEPMDVEPQFAAMVNEKRFPKMSASFFPPTHSANPKPGVWYLRHVGFLGAAAPAIPGLKMAEFGADTNELVTIDFAASNADQALWSLSMMARGLRDWMLEQFGAETANKVVPDYVVRDIETQQTEAMQEFSKAYPGFAAPTDLSKDNPKPEVLPVDPNKDKDKDKTADFAARESQLAAREKALADKELAAQQEAAVSFAAQLVTEGKLLPGEKDGLVSFMASLDQEQTVSFAAADGEVKKPASEWLRDFLSNLPARVDFSEHSGKDKETVDFSENPKALAAAATQYQAEMQTKGVTISATDAVKHVQKGNA